MKKGFLHKAGALSMSVILALTSCAMYVVNLSAQENDKTVHQIKNIIYMIPDGAGFPAYNVAKEVKKAGGLKFAYSDSFTGTVPTAKEMYLDDYLVGACTTKSANSSVTDSGAAATALATGNKTNNKYVGLDASLKPKANILELAQLEGKMTGIVVTSNSYDATPGGFSVHVPDREMAEEIINQQANSDIDIIIGAGIDYKVPDGETIVKNGGYVTVSTEQELRDEIASYKAGSDKKIWGTMNKNDHHMPYDYMYGKKYDEIDDTEKNVPTLAEMTELSIDMLDKSENGFFIMVEGSKVDYGCHAGNLMDSSSEYIAFDEAFKVALDYAENRTDTMIVVVPDHNTGLMVTPLDKKENSSDDRPTMQAVVKKIQTGSSTIVSDTTLEYATNELYTPVSEMKDVGRYENGKFIFNDGTICVANSDVAVLQGIEKYDMDGEICLYQDNIFYVPKKLLDKIGIEYDISTEGKLRGSGTKEAPYIIGSENNFLLFTDMLKNGNTYENQYIKQTKDIDMSKLSDYKGIGKETVFKGCYDGQGHTRNVSVEESSDNDIAVFPDIDGTIINLGTTGNIENTASDGGCAGIAHSISDGGKIINCWSTVMLKSQKNAGGITGTVNQGGKAVNCYYKGKITCRNNYGIGMAAAGSTIENCYYQMADGSSGIVDTGDAAGGRESTKFDAETLNKYISDVNVITNPEDKLCRFEDVEGHDFAFAGNYARLKKLCYKYTDKNGVEKTFEVVSFDGDTTGYQVQLGKEVKVGDEITIYGEADGAADTYTVIQGTATVNEYGFATGNMIVSGRVSTTDYVTTSSRIYAINFSVEAEEPGNIKINGITTNRVSGKTYVNQTVVFKTKTEGDTSGIKYRYEIRKGNNREIRC